MSLSNNQCLKARSDKRFDESVIQDMYDQKYFHIWVPQEYGGLDYSLIDGLKTLLHHARIDPSLGWLLTLCSGANFFLRHLHPDAAQTLMRHPRLILGGSGAVQGIAEVLEDGNYLLKGTWPHATGSIHLSHFTLSAPLYRDGKPILDNKGMQQVLSFVVPADVATIHPEWGAPGMKATVTYPFSIDEYYCSKDFTFVYDKVYTPNELTEMPFKTFADFTLFVCYLGVAYKMVDLLKDTDTTYTLSLGIQLDYVEQKLYERAQNSSDKTAEEYEAIHSELKLDLDLITHIMFDCYRRVGLSKINDNHPMHLQMLDFLTMSQHRHFR